MPGDSRRGDYCISFYYNMHGFHIGSLELVIIGDEKRVLWSRKGQHGDMWLYEAQTVNMQNGEVVSEILTLKELKYFLYNPRDQRFFLILNHYKCLS